VPKPLFFYIYRLYDKQEPSITRYVGMTTNIQQRLAQHLSCDGTNPTKDIWIRCPGVEVAAEMIGRRTTIEEARFYEAYWIHHYKDMGMPLTNQVIPPLLPNKKHSKKNTEEQLYMEVAIPRNSELAQYLLRRSAETGIAEGKHLVLTAIDYLRLIKQPLEYLQKQMTPPQPPAKINTFGARPKPTEGRIRILNMPMTYVNFAAFGDPD
jgi:hypothetical protein